MIIIYKSLKLLKTLPLCLDNFTLSALNQLPVSIPLGSRRAGLRHSFSTVRRTRTTGTAAAEEGICSWLFKSFFVENIIEEPIHVGKGKVTRHVLPIVAVAEEAVSVTKLIIILGPHGVINDVIQVKEIVTLRAE